MPCFHPREVAIKRKSLYTKRHFTDMQVVPCGSCIGCRAEQARQWAVRMMHEARMHQANFFVTLTYDERRLPDNGALCPKDFQRFVKDLRKAEPDRRFSYFGCGEYGERTQRPHYHALLFGFDFLDKSRSADNQRPNVWRSETLENIWGRGRTEMGSVTMASASYVAGYVRKKVKAERYERCNTSTGELLQPEFARMSLRPAIGKRWIARHWKDVYPRDFVVIDGVEAKPPRYYDKWMDKYFPGVMEDVRQKRIDEGIELTKYQLAAGEKIKQATINLFEARLQI